MELSEFVAGQVLDYVEKHEGFIPVKNLTELADILHSSISLWESKEVAELREKLASAEESSRDVTRLTLLNEYYVGCLVKAGKERDRLRKAWFAAMSEYERIDTQRGMIYNYAEATRDIQTCCEIISERLNKICEIDEALAQPRKGG